jgi:O-antigen/teichoic acid export membrane protein
VNSSDRYLIAFFRGTEELAIYAVAYGISAWTLQLVATPLFTSIPGALNSLWNSGKKEKAIELLKMIYKFFFLGATPIFSIVYFWRDFIIEKYVGSDYVSGGSIVVFVLFAYLLYYSSSFYRVIISWFEKTQIYMITFSIVAITNFILNLILVPQIGILGAAQSTTIAFALLFVLEYWYSRNLLNINLGIVRALLIFSIGFFLAWMFSMIPVDSIAGFIGSVSMFLVVYFGVVIGIRFVTIDEFKGITAQFKGQK